MDSDLSHINKYSSSSEISNILLDSPGNLSKPRRVMLTGKSMIRCLVVNMSEISQKLIQEQNLKKDFRIFNFNSNSSVEIRKYIRRYKIEIIVIEASELTQISKETADAIIDARLSGVKVYDAHEFYELVSRRVPLIRFETNKYLADSIFSIGMHKKLELALKNIFDFILVLAILPIVLPLILITSLLILFIDRQNPFFLQERVGKNASIFKIFKLRTMKQGHSGAFTSENDTRITHFGKLLRLSKIDELPQLLNVLKGEMSLIGPRPERPEFVKASNNENAYFDLRHLIKPGITGWAQVNLPKATPEDNLTKLEYDLYYIKNFNFLLDFHIIWKTIKVIIYLKSN